LNAFVEFVVAFAKWAALAFIFLRFHGSWLGAIVVAAMAFLLFRVDRAVWRFASGKRRS